LIVKRVSDYEPFTSIDGCQIVEVIGLKTTGTREVSLAYATLKPGMKTIPHHHEFTEIYMIEHGEGIMHLNGEKRKIKAGDNILIPARALHHLENIGEKELTLWCVCSPAYTSEKTTIKNT
jgi:mannose-6-phosphate isomerase-like protein (cupin superfamily)